MPGYKVTPVERLKSGLVCRECQLVLREPVQTEDGDRLCRSCYDDINRTGVSKCGIEIGNGECYPDRAVGREINQLMVKCSNHWYGCTWMGMLSKLEAHAQCDCKYQPQKCSNAGCEELLSKLEIAHHEKDECPFRPVTCQYCHQNTVYNHLQDHYRECAEYPIKCDRCSKMMKKYELEDHKDTDCPYTECLCGKKLLRKDWVEHFNEPGALSTHVKSMMTVHGALLRAHRHLEAKIEQELALIKKEPKPHPGELLQVRHELEAVQNKFDIRFSILEQKISNVGKSLEDQKQIVQQQQASMRKAPGPQRFGHYSESSSEARILQLEKRVEDLETQNTMLRVHVSELELQLQASLASTHNGAFLWRIPDVLRRRRDAQEERITSIYSPPFYTGRNGYKMCIRAYLNGDGIGYRTHLSLFFVLMKGEYDPLLRWPFEHKVSLILVDQNHRKHVVQTFKPTPDSSSFRRPKSDMNVASGCPQFAKLDVLDDKNFTENDIMYIKCVVDVSRIFHP